jgi:HD-GYP domain-containing protein (c-di-GMP phosphodiesterase class II)
LGDQEVLHSSGGDSGEAEGYREQACSEVQVAAASRGSPEDAAPDGRRAGEKEQEEIYELGLLHDIGKIGVSEEIINKEGRLTDEEFDEIKKHTLTGWEILKTITEIPWLSKGARWHHERYDGNGYPDGLKGKEIPEEARIICLADSYDAMTSKRSYSVPKSQKEVRDEIVRCSGTQFDPDIAIYLLEMIDEDTEFKLHGNLT